MITQPAGKTRTFKVTLHDTPDNFDAKALENAVFRGTTNGYGPLFVPADISVTEVRRRTRKQATSIEGQLEIPLA